MKYICILLALCTAKLCFAQPANDDCTNAEAITLTTTDLTVNFFIVNATINTEDGCSGAPENYADVWYSFTMPVDGNIFIDGEIIWNQFAIYDACNGNLIACDNDELYATNIAANTDLVLRVFRTENLANHNTYQSFTIRAFETPINDTCDNSINIPLNQSLQEVVDFTIGGSGVDTNFGCSNATIDYADVWFDFTMPFDGNIIIDGAILWNKFEIYDDCSGTSLYCSQDALFALGLTGNTNYKLRVYRNTDHAFSDLFLTFTVQAFEAATNDSCNDAETITVSETATSIPFNTGGATIDTTTGCTTDLEDYFDVWFQFTLDETSDVTIDGVSQWNQFALYNSCSTSEIDCFGTSGTFFNLNAGTYYLRVFRDIAFASSASFLRFYISKSTKLGTEDFSLSNVKLYPIPAKDQLNVSSPKPISKLEIYNLLGKKLNQINNKNSLDVSMLNSGIYVLKINIDKETLTRRIIVQ